MNKKIKSLLLKKGKNKIVSLTAYSKNFATEVDKFADITLVGDSLGSVLYNYETTRKVTLNKPMKGDVKKSKVVALTKKGQKVAEDIAYRHNLSEYFLCNTLGIPWYEVHQHAHLLEHAMTPVVVRKLAEFLGNPEFCPHGTPMPGKELPENTIALMESKPGMTVEIAMIGEALEDLQLFYADSFVETFFN